MALSVLHKRNLNDDTTCGVWCSVGQKWVFNGPKIKCENFKHEVETIEQQTDNKKWLQELKISRSKMGIK